MRVDYDGEYWHILIGAAVGLVSQYVFDVTYNICSGKSGTEIFVPTSSIVDYIAAGAIGALAATGMGAAASLVANVAIDTTAYLLNCAIDGEEINNTELIATVILSAATAGKGADGAKLRGVYKRSKEVLETAVSPKKIALYSSKISTVKNKVVKEVKGSIYGSFFSGAVEGFCDLFGW